MNKPGHTLSHYSIVEKIGEGGMGEVNRPEDTKLALLAAWGACP